MPGFGPTASYPRAGPTWNYGISIPVLPDQTRARAVLVQAPSFASGVQVGHASVAIDVEVSAPSGAVRVRVY